MSRKADLLIVQIEGRGWFIGQMQQDRSVQLLSGPADRATIQERFESLTAEPEPPTSPTTRQCLICGQPFRPAHKGNRLCPPCNEWASAIGPGHV